jgi:Na+-transporting NADH:ubiquinone oxidoreductase subunit NqrB
MVDEDQRKSIMGTRRWVGRSIIAVGAIHCLAGAFIFATPLMAMLNDGVWNSVDGFRGRPLAFWFEFAGLLTIVLGSSIDWMEQRDISLPPIACHGFGALVVLAIVAMPVGGGWLLVPSAVGLLMKRHKGTRHAV